MPAIEICPDVFWVGVNDRTTDLFEGIWPITQEGVSYNAYLVRDEKRAIIDLAKAFKTDEFFDQVSSVIPLSALDYIVLNHMEPDHTGVLRMLLRLAPQATLLGSEKTGGLLKAFYGITENFRPVQDGETLPLGRRTLQFFSTPFLHWPETIMTYETTHRILFSCDGFGGYGALRGGIFDDECTDLAFYEKEALRYYANIIAKFSRMVLRAIERLGNLPIAMVAPSHGLIWRRDPGRILELCRRSGGSGGRPALRFHVRPYREDDERGGPGHLPPGPAAGDSGCHPHPRQLYPAGPLDLPWRRDRRAYL
jgi:flavorubredoxin